MVNGRPVDIDPIAAMFSRPWAHETLHALLACYQATAFALAAVHAAVLLKHPASALFRKALNVSLAVACVTALLQPLAGDFASRENCDTPAGEAGRRRSPLQDAEKRSAADRRAA